MRKTAKHYVDNSKHQNECLNKAGDNEPLFVLRAQDKSTPRTILLWMADNVDTLSAQKMMDALSIVIDMKHWRGKKKRPD